MSTLQTPLRPRFVPESFERLERRVHLAADLPAAADAYVRDGTYAGSNFGADPTLIVKWSVNVGNTRESYLRFNIADVDVAAGQSVKLRLYGRLADTQNNNLPVGVYSVANTSWTEGSLTWNNKPALGSTITSFPSASSGSWVELDLTRLGIEPGSQFQVHDLLSGARYLWSGARNFVQLDPQRQPAHVFRVRRRVRHEQDFDYFL